MTRAERIKRISIKRERTIRDARNDFYKFCQAIDPDFYLPGIKHLTDLCHLLQTFYERKLLRPDGNPYLKLKIHIPPQFGKSRTLIRFCMWAFGQNHSERIITCSYSDDKASEFSKYARNDIQAERILPYQIVYSDIFPNVKIKHNDSSILRWALENEHLSYKSAGIDGGVTGTGGTIRIIDDPIKNNKIAYNDFALDTIWKWYANTFLSRALGEPLDLIVMTRWASGDIAGRLENEPVESKEWYSYSLEAYDEKKKKLLCDKFLPWSRYLSLRRLMDPSIFRANYHQEPIDIEGCLYRRFKTYDKIPKKDGKIIWDRIIAYGDTADDGSDYLSIPVAGQLGEDLYLLDVLYTKDPMEVTELAAAKLLYRNGVNYAMIESNSGGKGFARNVKRLLSEKFPDHKVVIKWFHQSANKQSRINSMSAYVQEHIYYPVNWYDRWPGFWKAITKYSREGKNKHDDGPDSLTGLCEISSTKKKARAVKSLY